MLYGFSLICPVRPLGAPLRAFAGENRQTRGNALKAQIGANACRAGHKAHVNDGRRPPPTAARSVIDLGRCLTLTGEAGLLLADWLLPHGECGSLRAEPSRSCT